MLLYNFDILCLCETWLTTEVPDGELYLQSYTLYRSNRSAKEGSTSHGGTMIAVKNSISSDELETDFETDGSIAACKVCIGNLSIAIVCVYSPPVESKYTFTSDDFERLYSFLKKQHTFHDELIIYGDFNLEGINWKTLESKTDIEKRFLDMLDDLHLHQKVDFDTCSTGILDLVLTSRNVSDVVLEPLLNYQSICNLSKHKPIIFFFTAFEQDLCLRKFPHNQAYSFCRADFESIRNLIEQAPFDTFCWSNVDVIVDNWYIWLEKIIKACVPRRTKHRSSLSPWISQETSHALKCLRTKRKRYHETHPTVQQLLQKVVRMAEEDKNKYESQLADSRSSTALFKYFKAFKKETLPAKLKWKENQADSDTEKAKLFADFFASTYSTSSKFEELSTLSDVFIPRFETIEFTRQEISTICSQLLLNKSKGPDQLPPVLFREASEQLSMSLYQIFKKALQTSVFPSTWKEAIVSPVYKKGSKLNVENYRPVSLLCVPSKIFERIIFKRLFLHIAPILHDAQYGFRPGRSTVLQLLAMFSEIHRGLENDMDVDVILTDFSKAFDKVDHGILLKKLYHVGIDGKLLRLLCSYLSDRSQRVRVNASLSPKISVKSGVPQGSLLGPLLFLVYINDLPACFESAVPFLFADDAKLLRIGVDANTYQSELDTFYDWTVHNKLPLNLEKCSHITYKGDGGTFYLENEAVQNKLMEKDLGLIVQSDLKWSHHIDKACAKAFRIYFMIKRNVSNLSYQSKLQLYKSMIVPTVLYASCCYGLTAYVSRQLENLQRRIVKWILGTKCTYKEALFTLQLLPLTMYVQLNDVLLLSKLMKGYYEAGNLELPEMIPSVRGDFKFNIQRPSRAPIQHAFLYRTARIVNILKLNIIDCDQKSLKCRLLQLFWKRVENFDENLSCTWKIACDCTRNNCRDHWNYS